MYGNIPYVMPGMAMPYASSIANVGNLGSAANGGITSLLGKIKWSSLLSNAQKTLSVVNQAIPLYYQVKPVFKNIKALGKIGKEFTKINNSSNVVQTINNDTTENLIQQEQNASEITQEVPNPTFFL